MKVLERIAAERGSALTVIGRDVTYERRSNSLRGQTMWLADARVGASAPAGSKRGLEVRMPLLGAHQLENAAVAAVALWELRTQGLRIPDRAIREGFSKVHWHGRFEVLQRDPPVVIDSAHNRDSASRLRETLDSYFPGRPVIWIFCALEDKDISGMLAELQPVVERVIVTRVDHPRAPSTDWLAAQVEQAGIPNEAVLTTSEAFERAAKLAGRRALVLVAGSVAFAGEMRMAWFRRKRKVAGRKLAGPARS
jgi:dihydrofolate synthase/folylpolyglutamate synthase